MGRGPSMLSPGALQCLDIGWQGGMSTGGWEGTACEVGWKPEECGTLGAKLKSFVQEGRYLY